MVTTPVNIPSLLQHAKPEVVSAIRKASEKTGVDFSYLLQNAAAESNLNPAAGNSASSAKGLFQFIDSTWLDTVDRHGAEHGLGKAAAAITRDSAGKPVVNDPGLRKQILALRDNPNISALMAAEFTKDNKVTLESTLGRKVDNSELYMAHFLGASGAGRFISKMETTPTASASQLLPHAASANQQVFFEAGKALSVSEVHGRLAKNFVPEAALVEPAKALAHKPMLSSWLDAVTLALQSEETVAADASAGNAIKLPYSRQAFELELLKSLGLRDATQLMSRRWKA